MFYLLGAVFTVVVAVLVVMDQRAKRRNRDRDDRRAERQRLRLRDWTVWEWIHGKRADLRITHQPEAAED